MEIILALVLVGSSFMTSLDNTALRQQNDALRLENQKLTIEREYRRDCEEKKSGKRTAIENVICVVYSLN